MNEKEIKALIKQLRAAFKKQHPSKSDEEVDEMILEMFFNAYMDDKMDENDLLVLGGALGYALEEGAIEEMKKDKEEYRRDK